MKDYVVVTRARRESSRRWIQHAYGPYTERRAKQIKSNMKAEAEAQGYELEVSVHHIIDEDRLNEKQFKSELANKFLKRAADS